MDILTHTLSGIAIGTVLSSYSDKSIKSKLNIFLISGIGAALPDLDAISLWSHFDSTIGGVLRLNHKGSEIYSSRFWYSHHGFMHSIFAGILFTLLTCFVIYFLKKQRLSPALKLLLSGLFCGYIIHLLEDLPAPGSVWGGINLLWPAKSYQGGTGEIWWWNNYDLTLIFFIVISINFLIITSERYHKFKSFKLTTAIFIFGLILCIIQIKSRKVDFNYSSNTSKYNELELKSKEIQKRILGEKIYGFMFQIDNHLPINF
jgi:membrane-bound metal-dependent hydrolase YbcI (DUF457 family)